MFRRKCSVLETNAKYIGTRDAVALPDDRRNLDARDDRRNAKPHSYCGNLAHAKGAICDNLRLAFSTKHLAEPCPKKQPRVRTVEPNNS